MGRPTITPRGGPRYLTPASVQSFKVQPARETLYTVDDCALLAAMIAQRLQPTGNGAELVAPVRAGVLAVFDAATKRVTPARCDEVLRDACGVLVTVLSLAEADRVPIASAIVRELLTDGDDAAEVLDRAMRDACDRRREVTDDHRAKAAAILATFITREAL